MLLGLGTEVVVMVVPSGWTCRLPMASLLRGAEDEDEDEDAGMLASELEAVRGLLDDMRAAIALDGAGCGCGCGCGAMAMVMVEQQDEPKLDSTSVQHLNASRRT